MTSKKIGLCILALTVLLACGPNVKNETKKWENYQTAVTEQSAQYPNLKDLIATLQTEAQTKWQAAQNLTDEKEKAKAMREANTHVGELIDRLQEAKIKLETLGKNSSELIGMTIPQTLGAKRQEVVTKAAATIAEVRTNLSQLTAPTADAAITAVKAEISKLISASAQVNGVIKEAKKK
jgi:hypothetical protein